MKIGFLWHCVYPWDVRLEKMIDAVISSGHTACIICKGREDLPRRQRLEGLTIRRVMAPGLRQPWISKVATFPLYFNPFWTREVREAISEEELDALIVRDVPLALLAAKVGKRLRKAVILDMAENYPAALLSYDKWAYKPVLFGNAWLPRRYERKCLDEVDHVFVVADEQRARLLRSGTSIQKITLVGNTPVDSFLKSANTHAENIVAANASKLNLLYVGFIDPHRGTNVIIRALPALLNEFPGLTLTLVGNGTARAKLVRLAEELGVAKSVSFPGWVDFAQVPNYIRQSDICLIPHLESEHTNTTLPNKLFDYMAFSKPIIAADCKPLRRVIEEANCGVTFKSGDSADLIRAIRQLARDPLRVAKGKNGRAVVERKYNWEIDKNVFVNAIENVRSRTKCGTRTDYAVHHYC